MKAEDITYLPPHHFLVKVDVGETVTASGIVVADVWEGGMNLQNKPEGYIVLAGAKGKYMDDGTAMDSSAYSVDDKVVWKRNCDRQFWKEQSSDGEIGYSIVHAKNLIAKMK